MCVTASGRAFRDAEDFAREILRWALKAKATVRNSVLYVLGNCESA